MDFLYTTSFGGLRDGGINHDAVHLHFLALHSAENQTVEISISLFLAMI